MAKLMTAYLFRWEEVEAKSDLERLRLVLDHLPDETVMRRLEEHRKWEREYKKRTAVERVNSRLDVSFGFEKHFIRGQKKMEVRVGLALCVMLAMAVGRIKEEHQELMRSLVKSPIPLDKAA